MGLKKKILAVTAAIGLSMFSMKGVASLDLNDTKTVQNYTQQIEQVITDINKSANRDGIIVTTKARLTEERAEYIAETLYEEDKSTSVEDLLKRKYIYLRIFPNSYGTIKTLIENDLEGENGEIFDNSVEQKEIREYVRNSGRSRGFSFSEGNAPSGWESYIILMKDSEKNYYYAGAHFRGKIYKTDLTSTEIVNAILFDSISMFSNINRNLSELDITISFDGDTDDRTINSKAKNFRLMIDNKINPILDLIDELSNIINNKSKLEKISDTQRYREVSNFLDELKRFLVKYKKILYSEVENKRLTAMNRISTNNTLQVMSSLANNETNDANFQRLAEKIFDDLFTNIDQEILVNIRRLLRNSGIELNEDTPFSISNELCTLTGKKIEELQRLIVSEINSQREIDLENFETLIGSIEGLLNILEEVNKYVNSGIENRTVCHTETKKIFDNIGERFNQEGINESYLKKAYVLIRAFEISGHINSSEATSQIAYLKTLQTEEIRVREANTTIQEKIEPLRIELSELEVRRGELEDENRTVSNGSVIGNMIRRSIEEVQADILTNSNSISGVETKISNLENQIEENNQRMKSMLASLETFFKNSLKKVRNLRIELDRISIANILGRGQSE